MNWDAIAAIGQMLGSVAVFVTLGYLAVQVRHTRDEMRRSVFQSRQEAIRELCLSRANSERYLTSAVAVAGAISAGSLLKSPFIQELIERMGVSAEGAISTMWDEHAWWYMRMQQIPYVKELPPGERAAFEKGIRGNYSTSVVGRLWWEHNKDWLNPDAVRYIDNLLAQPG